MSDEVHIGDVGTVIKLTIEENGTAIDVTAATSIIVDFERPDGSTLTLTGYIFSGTSGIVAYDSLAATFDQAGPWRAQARVVLGAATWRSSIAKFNVYGNLV